ncbi:ImmA/IrrE family metallo-endopeptidase [Liquorilactobacillus uvarum]|uniref:ImmA/IrrE family metallo-endopeptidase n=1 Tax=Liquorilactobacillus uvarum TaxID=303240 RepID=UPI002889713C|nr:ImmA/IrrE family metallo-endopeptidase [Liquorilactobacillus uvarum]
MQSWILDSLLCKAKFLSIRVIWSNELKRDTPPTASFKHRSIVMNENWHNTDEIIFQLAHELGHILTGDRYDSALYQQTFNHHALIEYKANLGAIELLLPYYCENVSANSANSADFINLFCIPSHLTEDVTKLMLLYYKKSQKAPH